MASLLRRSISSCRGRERSRNSPRRPKPALLTSKSIGMPPRESCSARIWPAPDEDRSTRMAITETGLALRNSFANACRGSEERATRTRLQWRSASARANAIPSPREAPVMRAKPSYFISVFAQGSAHRFRESSIEHAVPVERIEPVMQKPADDAFAWRKTAMQNIPVEEIFDESPGRATCREKSYCCPSVRCRKGDSQHENRIQRVEDGQRVETTAGKSGLTPLEG